MAGIIDLWRRRRGADRFEALVRPHVPSLYRLAYRLCGEASTAEDLVQETLVRVYPRRDELANLDRLYPWLSRVLYRIYVDSTRRRRRAPILASDLDPSGGQSDGDEPAAFDPPASDPAGQPEEATQRSLDHQRLQQALDALTEPHRTVIVMHELEGLSLDEIERATGVTVGTLKSRLHRARNQLRMLLRDGTDSD